MASRKMPGLVKRGNTWHIKKRIKGQGRLNESTGTTDYAEAERYLAHRLEQIRRVCVYGDRPVVTFREAAEKFLQENGHLRALDRAAEGLDCVMPYIGDKSLEHVHDDTLATYKKERAATGVKAATINRELDVVRRVLMLAARKWRHPNGTAYLSTAPLLSRMPETDKRQPYPLTWAEQRRLLPNLPAHLADMALFDVNTGLRDAELTGLRWDWEIKSPELGGSAFILPSSVTKNGEERVVLLNDTARSVLEARRGGREYVFMFKGQPITRMNNTAWRMARDRAGLTQLRVHDLRHTFAHRLRSAGVSHEDRAALLGHTTGNVTTHYSQADLARLLECVRLLDTAREGTVLRLVPGANQAQEPRSLVASG